MDKMRPVGVFLVLLLIVALLGAAGYGAALMLDTAGLFVLLPVYAGVLLYLVDRWLPGWAAGGLAQTVLAVYAVWSLQHLEGLGDVDLRKQVTNARDVQFQMIDAVAPGVAGQPAFQRDEP